MGIHLSSPDAATKLKPHLMRPALRALGCGPRVSPSIHLARRLTFHMTLPRENPARLELTSRDSLSVNFLLLHN